MFTRLATFATLAFTAVTPAFAQQSDSDELFDLLRMSEILEIMRLEGVGYGDTIGQDLFGGEPSADWDRQVERIYTFDRMVEVVRDDFASSLEGVDVDPMLTFFGSDQGQMFITLEISARRALLDDAVEEASKDAAAIAAADEDERYMMVGEFVESNNLIEANVAGALNSNLAFYEGLVDGGAFQGTLTEEQILTDVWSQESDIRENTTEWIYSFLFLAYQPVEDTDLEAYIAFSQSEAGVAFNRAMFTSFDRLFVGISRELGRAAANEMTSTEL